MKTNSTVIPTLPPASARHTKSQSQPTYWALLLLCLSVFASPARCGAQDVPRLQFFGGYSFTRFQSTTFGFSSGSNLNGWNVAVSGNIIRNLGGTAELSGQYGNHMNLRDFAAGPQILYPRGNMLFFAHALFGKGRTFVNEGGGVGDTQRAYLFGGGLDMPFRHRFDIRVFQADYIRTQLLGQNQNNFRVSAGVVYHWGEIRRTKHRPPNTQAP
jgi:putative cofactor-binding repeat protein